MADPKVTLKPGTPEPALSLPGISPGFTLPAGRLCVAVVMMRPMRGWYQKRE